MRECSAKKAGEQRTEAQEAGCPFGHMGPVGPGVRTTFARLGYYIYEMCNNSIYFVLNLMPLEQYLAKYREAINII